MGETASRAALLHGALDDLRAAKLLQVDRLPALARAVEDPALAAIVAVEAERARTQGGRIERLDSIADGPRNLWMAGILDDADRDARSLLAGPLRDIALTAALRKAKAAEIVSTETALTLALDEADALVAALEANRAEEIATDEALRERLAALAA